MSTFELRNNKTYLNGVETPLTSVNINSPEFLGASVSSCNGSIGWNGSRSSFVIELAEDHVKDQKFVVPIMGSPHFFKIEDKEENELFKFNGIVKSVDRKVSPQGGRTFSATLESPEVILESAAVITKDYTGEGFSLDKQGRRLTRFADKSYDWEGIRNVINVFGFWENDEYGVNDPTFGKSDNSDNGMLWHRFLIAADEIINRQGSQGYFLGNGNVLGGTLAYSSDKYNEGRPYEYMVNFDNLIDVLKDYLPVDYRIASFSSLLTAIEELCNSANCQWYVTLDENEDEYKSTYTNQDVDGIINIHAYPLNNLPDIGQISSFSLAKEGPASNSLEADRPSGFSDEFLAYVENSDEIINMSNSSLGVELADVTTGKVVVGDYKTHMIEQGITNTYMYWGNLQSRNLLFADIPILTPLLSPVSDADVIAVDLRGILGTTTLGTREFGREFFKENSKLLPPTVIEGIYYTSILELRCAANDQESWENYLTYFKQKKSRDLLINGDLRKLISYQNGAEILTEFGALKANNLDTIFDQNNLSKESISSTNRGYSGSSENTVINKIWRRLQDLYSNYYGKEFVVPIPISSYDWEPESRTFTSEWQIHDSAFTDGFSGPNAPTYDIKFTHQSGRTSPYVAFPYNTTIRDVTNLRITSELDFSELDGKDTSLIGNRVYVKSNVDTETLYTTFPLPNIFNNGIYGNIVSDVGFQHPQILNPNLQDLSQLQNGRPTTDIFGFYTDARGAVPFARVTLPGKVRYMSQALGFRQDMDGLGLISEILKGKRLNRDQRNISEISVGSDRLQTPIGDGFYLPELVSVPLKSNRHTYGPWIPSFNDYVAGKVEIEVDKSLAPENFVVPGVSFGHEGMDFIGWAKSLPDNVGYFANESGSFTIAGIPKTNLGEALILGGPYLTDLSISIDPNQGVTSSFTMKTWNLDFGRIKKYYLDKFKNINQEIIKIRKEASKKSDASLDFNRRIFNLTNKFAPAERFRSHSSSPIIAGYVQDTVRRKQADGEEDRKVLQQSSVSILSSHNFVGAVQNNYEDMAATSLDSIFVPFTCDPGSSGNLPKMDEDPIELHGNLKKLNPLFPFGATSESGNVKFVFDGPNTNMVVRGTGLPPDLNSKFSLNSEDFVNEDPYGFGGRDIRSMAFRTPQVKVGYGYNENGVLLPTGVDGETADDYHLNISNWKVGPAVDVFDEHKKVWYGGFPIMKGLLKSDLSAGSLTDMSDSNVLRFISDFIPKDGILHDGSLATQDTTEYEIVGDDKIYCEDPSINTAPKGALVYYMNIDGRNMPIYIGCAASTENINIVNTWIAENE